MFNLLSIESNEEKNSASSWAHFEDAIVIVVHTTSDKVFRSLNDDNLLS